MAERVSLARESGPDAGCWTKIWSRRRRLLGPRPLVRWSRRFGPSQVRWSSCLVQTRWSRARTWSTAFGPRRWSTGLGPDSWVHGWTLVDGAGLRRLVQLARWSNYWLDQWWTSMVYGSNVMVDVLLSATRMVDRRAGQGSGGLSVHAPALVRRPGTAGLAQVLILCPGRLVQQRWSGPALGPSRWSKTAGPARGWSRSVMVVVKCPVRDAWPVARGWTKTWCSATVSAQRGTDEYRLTPLIPAGGRQRGPRSRRRGGGTRRESLPRPSAVAVARGLAPPP